MADKKKAKNQMTPEDVVRQVFNNFDRNDDALTKLLQHRIERNKEMGLESSPDDTKAQYGYTDAHFFKDGENILGKDLYGGNTRGYVDIRYPKEININPVLKDDEDSLKYTLAHELQHVNQLANKDKNFHEKTDFIYDADIIHPYRPFSGQNRYASERLRRLRSLMHPSQIRSDIKGLWEKKPSNETLFDVSKVLKYAKEQGVPVDDIIDAMTMNAALGSDELAREAHQQTVGNQEVGRGILGDVGLEKPLSTEDVYKPWKEMKEKRKNKK